MLIKVLKKQDNIELEQYVTDIKKLVTLDSIVLAVFKIALYIGSILLHEILLIRILGNLAKYL